MNNKAKEQLAEFLSMVSKEMKKDVASNNPVNEDVTQPPLKENNSVENILNNIINTPEKKPEITESETYTPLGVYGDKVKTVDPLTPFNGKNYATLEDLQNHYSTFLSKIQQQMSTIGGGGEVKLRYLDDVDRSSIIDEGYLNYKASTGKFVFSKLPSVTTASVTDATYTLTPTDSYIGINYAGAVEITLPSVDVVNGRLLYIKDESGAAETNPITVLGTVDNDAGGFTLQINNGSITLIYRDGWRIV